MHRIAHPPLLARDHWWAAILASGLAPLDYLARWANSSGSCGVLSLSSGAELGSSGRWHGRSVERAPARPISRDRAGEHVGTAFEGSVGPRDGSVGVRDWCLLVGVDPCLARPLRTLTSGGHSLRAHSILVLGSGGRASRVPTGRIGSSNGRCRGRSPIVRCGRGRRSATVRTVGELFLLR